MFNLLICIMLLMVIDILSGYIKHLIEGDISSAKMRLGLLHKGQSILMIAAAYILHLFGTDYIEGTQILPYSVGGYIIIMEITSVIENLGFSRKLVDWIGGLKK